LRFPAALLAPEPYRHRLAVTSELSPPTVRREAKRPDPNGVPLAIGRHPPVRLPSGVAPPRAREFQVFKDMDDRTGQKIARKDIWVGAIATRTVVRELFDLSAFFAEPTVMLRVIHGHAPYHPWYHPR
jgi:hypothetical protein